MENKKFKLNTIFFKPIQKKKKEKMSDNEQLIVSHMQTFNNFSFGLFDSLLYLISQYFWVYLIHLSRNLIEKIKNVKIYMPERVCSQSTAFDYLYNPDYFYHLTDIHLTDYYESHSINFRKALDFGASYSSNTLLITGDISNSISPNPMISEQVPDDWKLYRSIIDNYVDKYDNVLDLAGNHDMGRIWSLYSDNNYYIKNCELAKHSNMKNSVEDFQLIVKEIGNFTHIMMHPFPFPFAPIFFDYYADPGTKFLDRLEKAIEKANDKKPVILSSHFNGGIWLKSSKSSKGNTIFDILNNEKVDMFVSGHNHGSNFMLTHYGNGLEISGSDLAYSGKAGFVTVDNKMPVFHHLDINKFPDFFVTYPIPIDQTTSRTVCDIQTAVIRVIANSDSLKLDASIDGGKSQQMNLERQINNNTWLYSLSLTSLSQGKHKLLVKSATSSDEFDFLYGKNQKTPSGSEYLWDDSISMKYYIYPSIIIFAIATFVTYPGRICSCFESITAISMNNYAFKLLYSFFLGFVSMRKRIMNLEKPLRIALFITTLSLFIVPLYTYAIDNHLCYIFFFGTITDGTAKYDRSSISITFIFLFYTIVPIILSFSSLGLTKYTHYSFVQIIDVLVYVRFLISNITMSTNFFSLFTGKLGCLSGVVIILLLWTVVFICYLIYDCKQKWAARMKSDDAAKIAIVNEDIEEDSNL